jgi:hypothetical protein
VSLIKTKRGSVGRGGESRRRRIDFINLLPGWDAEGPTVGLSIGLLDPKDSIVLELPVADTYVLALEMLGYVRVSSEKFHDGRPFLSERRPA